MDVAGVIMRSIACLLVLIALACRVCPAQVAVYPLHVGDRWEYVTMSDTTIYRVQISKDSTLFNGHTYALFAGPVIGNMVLRRQAGDSVFQFDQVSGEEHLLYNFSASVGDTVAQYPVVGDSTVITLIAFTPTAAINGRRQWVFLIDRLKHAIDDEEYDTVTDSVGITHIGCFCDPWILRGAVIDGVVYGVVGGVPATGDLLPGHFALAQNFPNPFNPSTSISFSIPTRSHIALAIYNMLGQQVARLVDEERMPGEYSVEWNPANVSSGVYFYRITAGAFSETKKMVLVR